MAVINRFSTVAVMMCLMLCLALPAMAQEGATQQWQPEETGDQPPVSDTDLVVSAKIYAKISNINLDFQQAVQNTQDQQERQQLQQEANHEIMGVIDDSDIDLETYNRIMQQVGSDEQIRERFVEIVQKKQ